MRTPTTWTIERWNQLKSEYAGAIQAGHDQFEFAGNTFSTVYAKYLISYLRWKFREHGMLA